MNLKVTYSVEKYQSSHYSVCIIVTALTIHHDTEHRKVDEQDI